MVIESGESAQKHGCVIKTYAIAVPRALDMHTNPIIEQLFVGQEKLRRSGKSSSFGFLLTMYQNPEPYTIIDTPCMVSALVDIILTPPADRSSLVVDP